MDDLQRNYVTQVYAAVLGKVIGVYLGRPFEGWKYNEIVEKWGIVDHYVHEDRGVPLVVPDDDISGTLTFIRALEDSQLYADTPDDFFGDTWLNYLLEKQTILWWGGMGHSTEHTAYLRLKAGIRAPESGSMTRNGQIVAEQIGAQIFIDGFGLVCPGRPSLAASLARKAASVSHDGEAVYAAMCVAAMEAAAFAEKDMEKLLDIGESVIPKDCLIAKLHRDIRGWCKTDLDWRKTYERIARTYGYDTYGGNCHIVPNHALMVMAWCYAPTSFRDALAIVNTCGWDTDCNSGNVGCLMGLVAGLDGICDDYDFRMPFGDRIILPTADGTSAVTDCLTEARKIARIGFHVMGWQPLPSAPHWFDFGESGSAQGFLPEPAGRGIHIKQVFQSQTSGLEFHYFMPAGGTATISIPISPGKAADGKSSYSTIGTGKLYDGMTIRAVLGECTSRLQQSTDTEATLFLRYTTPSGDTAMIRSLAVPLQKGNALELNVPELQGFPVTGLGMEIKGESGCEGTFSLNHIDLPQGPFACNANLPRLLEQNFPGWIVNCDILRRQFSDDKLELVYFGKNEGIGFAYTGNLFWKDVRIEAVLCVHLAETAGIIAHFQGLKRYISLTRRGSRLVLARQFYGETILAEAPCDWPLYTPHSLCLNCQGNHITALLDGKEILHAIDDKLTDGAAGLIYSEGLLGVHSIQISGWQSIQ